MPAFKPAYLVHGDNHGRIAERRARLRALAESESGAEGVEILEGEAAEPEAVAATLAMMTLAPGRRFVIVEGAERWKAKDVEPVVQAVAAIDGETTTVAFFAREDGRAVAPKELHAAVKRAGGDIVAEAGVKPWELPAWVRARAGQLGITLDQAAAKALVAQVGERQERLGRELETLALEHGEGAVIGEEEIEAAAARSAERRTYALADALAAGDRAAATALFVSLRSQGERTAGLLAQAMSRARHVHEISAALEAGEPPKAIGERFAKDRGVPAFRFKHLLAAGRSVPPAEARALVERLADAERDAHGAGHASDDTAVLRAILAV